MKVKKETVIRTTLTFLALVNTMLILFGKNPLPFSESEVFQALSAVFTFATSVWSWWKNNSFTNYALISDEYLKMLKQK